MKFTWLSDRARGRTPGEIAAVGRYESEVVVESKVRPGVRFRIARMSFARRMELMRRVRDLARQAEFLSAGPDSAQKMDAALLAGEIERIYVAWGVVGVQGLRVDGQAAGAEELIDAGPEALFREALEAVRRETGLSEEERKNC